MPSGSPKTHGRKCHPRNEVTCKICNEPFMPTSSQQKHCRKCIPDGKAWHHWYAYGITIEKFDRMMLAQQGKCAGCDCDFASLTGIKNDVAHIDHDHVTNEIRGLLCRSCNHILGLAEDNLTTLRRLVTYLERQKKNIVGSL